MIWSLLSARLRTLYLNDVKVDLARKTATRGDEVMVLTTKETEVLAYLASRPGHDVSRDDLLREVWGFRNTHVPTRAVDSVVQRLRQKLEPDRKRPIYLLTVHGSGYRFEPSEPLREVPQAHTTTGGFSVPLTPFVGREADQRQIASLLALSSVVTIVGTAGVGKSRLAREVGNHLLDQFPGGACLVRLNQARSEADVAKALAIELAVSGSGSVLDSVVASLTLAGHFLVVMDAVEGALEGAARVIMACVAAAPDATFLVTSRERLRISVEVAHQLEPLAPSAASELLGLAVGEGSWSQHDLDALAVRLQGIPLALNLATPWMQWFPPAELLSMLVDPIQVLRDGPRDVEPHHVSLEAAIRHSWDLLSDVEAETLAGLSVFQGPFRRSDAHGLSVLGTAEHAVVFRQLIEKSTVCRLKPSGGTAWFCLFDAVRDFARLRLEESGCLEAARGRHLEHFAGLCMKWLREVTIVGTSPAATRQVAVALRADVMEASRRARGSGHGVAMIQTALGVHTIAISVADSSLETEALDEACQVDNAPSKLRAECLLTWGQRRQTRAERLDAYARAAGLFELVGDCDGQARAHMDRAREYIDNGQFRQARDTVELILEFSGQTPYLEAYGHIYSSTVNTLLGDHPVALASLDRASVLARRHGYDDVEVRVLQARAEIALTQGDVDAAEGHVFGAFAALGHGDKRSDIAQFLKTLGCIRSLQGRHAEAVSIHDQVLEIGLRTGFRAMIVASAINGALAAMVGQAEDAVVRAERACSLCLQHDMRLLALMTARLVLVCALAQTAEVDAAEKMLCIAKQEAAADALLVALAEMAVDLARGGADGVAAEFRTAVERSSDSASVDARLMGVAVRRMALT